MYARYEATETDTVQGKRLQIYPGQNAWSLNTSCDRVPYIYSCAKT